MTRFFLMVMVGIMLAAPALAGDARPMPSAPAQKPSSPRPVPPEYKGDFMSVPLYDTLVRQAIRSRPKNFEFGTLRVYYTQVPQYDPIGDTARREIMDLAFTVQNDPDQNKRKEAFDKYGALVSAHLGNIDVVTQALALSREDKLFGDPAFFEYMRRGLLKSIMSSGDGSSLANAYDAMTLGEETALLNALRLRLIKTEPRESGGVYYNMNEVQEPDAAAPYWIFVDVSKPMVFLERQRQENRGKFSIPRQ